MKVIGVGMLAAVANAGRTDLGQQPWANGLRSLEPNFDNFKGSSFDASTLKPKNDKKDGWGTPELPGGGEGGDGGPKQVVANIPNKKIQRKNVSQQIRDLEKKPFDFEKFNFQQAQRKRKLLQEANKKDMTDLKKELLTKAPKLEPVKYTAPAKNIEPTAPIPQVQNKRRRSDRGNTGFVKRKPMSLREYDDMLQNIMQKRREMNLKNYESKMKKAQAERRAKLLGDAEDKWAFKKELQKKAPEINNGRRVSDKKSKDLLE